MVLHRSGLLLLSSSSGLVAVLPVLSGCALRRSLAVRRAVISLHPVSSRSAGPLVLTGWSRHCRITAGLASMDMPLLVSLLSLSAGGAVRGSTAPVGWSGVSPYFACCPSSSVLNRSSFGTSASGFRFKSSRWGHPSGSGLSQSSIGSKALAPPSWCMLRVFAMGSPCRVVVCSRSRSKRRLVCRTFPCGWCLAFAMGSPILGRVALLCALDQNEGFLHSSILSCFAMGSPGGSSVWFPALDRNEAVFG